jgi:riboflavin biosynthesis pyrimidine reductase
MLSDAETGALKRRRRQKGTRMVTQQPTTAASGSSRSLLALYPEPERTALEGLYLSHDLRRCRRGADPFVYSNFIASLDGRIAVADPQGGEPEIPSETANPRDWRLLLELAAPADALVVSGRYVRQLAEGSAQALPPLQGDVAPDILAFREALGLPAQPVLVVISNSLEVPVEALLRDGPRPVIVATSDAAGAPPRQLDGEHVDLIRVGGERVEGARLVVALAERDLKLIYSIAGPAVLHMLLAARVLRRLYLTTVLRVIGGEDYATMTRGARLAPPYDFRLAALYLDPAGGPGGIEQLLQVFEQRGDVPPR